LGLRRPADKFALVVENIRLDRNRRPADVDGDGHDFNNALRHPQEKIGFRFRHSQIKGRVTVPHPKKDIPTNPFPSVCAKSCPSAPLLLRVLLNALVRQCFDCKVVDRNLAFPLRQPVHRAIDSHQRWFMLRERIDLSPKC